MINFLRKIRQQLLTENKTGKYLKYAIGEIVLVVIGILIALQINNWNENRKNAIAETKILQHLVDDLTETKREITQRKLQLSEQLGSIFNIVRYIEDDVPIDSGNLVALISPSTGIFNSTNTTVNFIESEGMGILQNDSIRNSISSIYERFGNIHKREALTESRFYDRLIGFRDKYFGVKTKDLRDLLGTKVDSIRWSKIFSSTEIGLIDPIGLKKDQAFLNYFYDLRSHYQLQQLFFERTEFQIENVVNIILREIERLEN